MVTPKIQQALINHLDSLKLIDIAQHQGNMTLLTAGLTLVDQGITTITEIKRVIGMISEVEVHQ